ncbi:MAG: AraC family transcriptional regulator [Deltaproteobacteria bacterium]|nr:AraC family transcriptional regulator [Deltaproteobacteria bacterium]
MLLDRLLASLQIQVAPFAVCDVRRGWRVHMPPDGHVSLHFVVRGEGTLHDAEHREHALHTGTLIVAPPGYPLRVEPPEGAVDELDAAADCSLPEHGLKRLVAGDGDGALLMVCGAVQATYGGSVGVFDGLREPLVQPFTTPSMHAVFEGLLAEQATLGPGSQTMLRALMTQGMVALLRRLCDGPSCSLPWLAALGDERLVRALDAMLGAPQQPHTLESVARTAGMSRSAFSEHFTQSFGRPAMELLREVRLNKGAELLRGTELPVKTVAERIGFSSRSHFSRAFRAHFGVDPAGFRSGARADPSAASP